MNKSIGIVNKENYSVIYTQAPLIAKEIIVQIVLYWSNMYTQKETVCDW